MRSEAGSRARSSALRSIGVGCCSRRIGRPSKLYTRQGYRSEGVVAADAGADRRLRAVNSAPAQPASLPLAKLLNHTADAAQALRAQLAPKAPPPRVDALLLSALALLWPPGGVPYAEHTLVDQAVDAGRQRSPRGAAFVNAVLRRFLRERDALVAAALREPLARFNHPAWWIERLKADWPDRWQQ